MSLRTPEHRAKKDRNSGHGCHRSPILLRRGRNGPLLNRTTGLAHPRPCFQKGDFPTGKATIMDKLVADCATGPPPPKHCLVPIEVFLAHPAKPGLDPEQHRLPFPAAFSNTHKCRSIAGRSAEKQAKGRLLGLASGNPIARFSFQMHHSRNEDRLPFHRIDQAIWKPLEKIAPKLAFQNTPSSRVLLNVIEGQIHCI